MLMLGGVQRLVQIAHEMGQEDQRRHARGGGQAAVGQLAAGARDLLGHADCRWRRPP
jgi:hypothetical protein